MGSPELDRYLHRIAYTGPLAPTLETLNGIVQHHVRSIPFENLDPFLGTPNRLDLPSLRAKLVDRRRGGYCFEQNLLLADVLTELGYSLERLAARVLWGVTDGEVRPRTHMLLLVDVEGDRRVVDVGFGGMTLTGTLTLEPGVEQPTPLEPFRLTRLGDEYVQEVLVSGEWRQVYRFDLHGQHPVDYVPTNWYLSTHPESHFVTGLVAARATEDRRYALLGRRLTVHPRDGESTRRFLESPAELRAALEGDFGIDTSGMDLDGAFTRLPHPR
ncbi:arylamine N-acetyltransferase [Rhodococcus triatomae]|uniref:N-hydroxyarylamine O-acetyltransferase n=1 Tax=Rhodococcus triatomae TaxID=300028 RepID=A0A1G8L0V0_9NOCA|nr:arylamine N-acetyltransferase [Rhodococcus triatomae]QNG20479.1 arylamine N-acetyltransferase [Rhodococcus triatomae]QNG23603.1 arylamine N-acetyltransferase [Rhodococcus triatomae]SDI49299.1 N-hydroxyarylamine O-acetyltransferase [Rhodococcus triatomae]